MFLNLEFFIGTKRTKRLRNVSMKTMSMTAKTSCVTVLILIKLAQREQHFILAVVFKFQVGGGLAASSKRLPELLRLKWGKWHTSNPWTTDSSLSERRMKLVYSSLVFFIISNFYPLY